MSISDKANNIKTVMMGAILTGVALVIANSWGGAIKESVILLVNKVRCGKYLVLPNNKKDKKETEKLNKEYETCKNQESLSGLYINAVITSILLSIIVFLLFGKQGVSTMEANN
jgi:hypothetical protein